MSFEVIKVPASSRTTYRSRRPSGPGGSCSSRGRRRPTTRATSSSTRSRTRCAGRWTTSSRILAAAGLGLGDVVQVRGYLKDHADWDEYNRLYREYFTEPYPARTTIVKCLGQVKVEIDAVAYAGDRGARDDAGDPDRAVRGLRDRARSSRVRRVRPRRQPLGRRRGGAGVPHRPGRPRRDGRDARRVHRRDRVLAGRRAVRLQPEPRRRARRPRRAARGVRESCGRAQAHDAELPGVRRAPATCTSPTRATGRSATAACSASTRTAAAGCSRDRSATRTGWR